MKTTSWLSITAAICTVASVNAQNRPGRQGPPPEIIEKFDVDGDGKLSQEEREAARAERAARMQERQAEMLEKFDADGDGKLSPEERASAREARRAEMLEKFDTDGDGELSEEEKKAMPKPMRPPGAGPKGPKGPRGPRGQQGPPPAAE